VAVKVIKRTETQTGTRKSRRSERMVTSSGFVRAGNGSYALVVGAEPGYKRTYNVRTFIGT